MEYYSGVMESSEIESLKPYVLLRITERAKPDWYPKMKVFGILKEKFPLQTFKDGDMVSFKVLNIKAIEDGQFHTMEHIREYYIYEGDFEICKE
ncbi:MAG: hypothetical protein K6G08_03495 [Prevotella sp.]|nr:hypothetical protein [Prevotella sp.]